MKGLVVGSVRSYKYVSRRRLQTCVQVTVCL